MNQEDKIHDLLNEYSFFISEIDMPEFKSKMAAIFHIPETPQGTGTGYTREQITDAHMAGQSNAGCKEPSYSEAFAYASHASLPSAAPQDADQKGEGWIRCEDGLPELKGKFVESDYVLCCNADRDNSFTFVGWYNKTENIWRVAHHLARSEAVEVTHWKPLPPPPTH